MQLLADLLTLTTGDLLAPLPADRPGADRDHAEAMAAHYRAKIAEAERLHPAAGRRSIVAELAEALAAWEAEVARHPA